MNDSTAIPRLGFVGYSGSGKTTLISKLVRLLKLKGFRIGVLKHDAHDFQMDVEGKDTYKFSEAGADLIAISSATKLNILEKLTVSLEVDEILQRMTGVDLIIIEGYKQADIPKILVARTLEQLALISQLDRVIAVAAALDPKDVDLLRLTPEMPCLDLNDAEQVVEFVEAWLYSF